MAEDTAARTPSQQSLALGVFIGRYTLRDSYTPEPGYRWLERDNGEGGDFPIAAIEVALDKFFDEHF